MRNILKRLVILAVIIAMIVPSVNMVAQARNEDIKEIDTISTVKASVLDGKIIVEGTTVNNPPVYAVAVMIYDSRGVVVAMQTESVVQHGFISEFSGLPDGTYTVKAANYEGGPFKETTVTIGNVNNNNPIINTRPGSTTTTPDTNTTPAGPTVSVSGDSSTSSQVNVSVNNGNATIGEISQSAIDATISNSEGNGSQTTTPGGAANSNAPASSVAAQSSVSIDLSSDKSVTSATLTTATVERISDTVKSEANNVTSMEIKFAEGSVSLDSTALSSITSQAAGESVTISVKTVATTTLQTTQQTAIAETIAKANEEAKEAGNTAATASVEMVVSATVTSGNRTISNFGGGNEVISMNYNLAAGRNGIYLHVYYVANDGTMVLQQTSYANGMISFVTSHNSDYVVIYDETKENDSFVEVYRLRNKKNNEHLYTTDANEVAYHTARNWESENSPGKGLIMGGTPVYRLFNKVTGEHLYTADANECKYWVGKGIWVYDNKGKPIFYSAESGKAVYRLYNPKEPVVSSHHNTSDENEIRVLTTTRGYTIENNKKPVYYLQ